MLSCWWICIVEIFFKVKSGGSPHFAMDLQSGRHIWSLQLTWVQQNRFFILISRRAKSGDWRFPVGSSSELILDLGSNHLGLCAASLQNDTPSRLLRFGRWQCLSSQIKIARCLDSCTYCLRVWYRKPLTGLLHRPQFSQESASRTAVIDLYLALLGFLCVVVVCVCVHNAHRSGVGVDPSFGPKPHW